MRALAMFIHVRTYLLQFNNEMLYCYDIIPTAVPWGFFNSKYYLFWDKMTPIWKQCLAKLYAINLSIHMYIKIRSLSGEYRSKYIFFRASRLSRTASIRVYVEVPNG